MVEQWNITSAFESYYQECQPTQCTYVFQTRNDAIYIVTTLVGLVGGLNTVLKFVTPRQLMCSIKVELQRSYAVTVNKV